MGDDVPPRIMLCGSTLQTETTKYAAKAMQVQHFASTFANDDTCIYNTGFRCAPHFSQRVCSLQLWATRKKTLVRDRDRSNTIKLWRPQEDGDTEVWTKKQGLSPELGSVTKSEGDLRQK